MSDTVYVATRLSTETHEALRKASYETRKSQSRIIEEAVRAYLKEEEPAMTIIGMTYKQHWTIDTEVDGLPIVEVENGVAGRILDILRTGDDMDGLVCLECDTDGNILHTGSECDRNAVGYRSEVFPDEEES